MSTPTVAPLPRSTVVSGPEASVVAGAVPPRWTALLAGAVRDPLELARRLQLDPALISTAAHGDFPLLVPDGYVARIRPGDPRDPLLLQVLPAAAETWEQPADFSADPLAEADCSPLPGLLRKYHGRALLVTTGACAVHCRYCFRRHFPYAAVPRGAAWWQAAVATIAADPSVSEVLLSGGDPLTLPDVQLARLAGDLAAIPHLKRLRVHTRLPVVIPERVDAALLAWLTGTRLQPVVVIHANHPREIAADVAAALGRLRAAGIAVFNQAVLLRGINDDVGVLAELSEVLFAAGCVPYYLHALDRVKGAAHMVIDDAQAVALHEQLAARLPGYLLPRLVREIPGDRNKTPLR